MEEPRLLPHLAAACSALLGEEDPKKISPAKRAEVAAKAGVGDVTVKRFLESKHTPRSRELDNMVAAVAITAKRNWLVPWEDAIQRARDAKVDWARYLSGEEPVALPPEDEPGGERSQRHRR